MNIYRDFCTETFDEKGKLTDFTLHYPENFNFGYDVVDRIAGETPEKRAIVWCNAEGEEHVFRFEDVRKMSNRYANVLKGAGIGRGDRVMLILKRHFEYWFAVVALHKLGAVCIPATHMLTEADLEYRFQAARVKGVICTVEDQVPERVRTALANAKMEAGLWSVRGKAEGFTDLNEAAEQADETLSRVETLADDPMMLYFTSGTTGYPKGVIHSFVYPLGHIVTAKYWQQAQEDGLHFTVAETGWAKASWGKIYGQWLVGSAVMVYDFDHFDPRLLTGVINKYGVTSFCAPPTVYRYLVRKGIPPMPSLRHASTAGEMLAPDVFDRFTEKTGLTLCEGYGQTETTLIMANFHDQDAVAGSMGTPSPFYQVALLDREGQPVPDGEIGEVVIIPRGEGVQPGIFTGYLDNDVQYKKVWRGGVYHTGDAAWRDSTGHYWFHGRFDDIIKTSGFRVGPGEVENVLMEHPAVAECSVIGVPDALRGQSIKAVIVLGKGYGPSRELENEIKNFCNQKLAEYKWIRLIDFVREMPRTISGKIRKNVLRDRGTLQNPGARLPG